MNLKCMYISLTLSLKEIYMTYTVTIYLRRKRDRTERGRDKNTSKDSTSRLCPEIPDIT